MKKVIYVIGGGELKTAQTYDIDSYIVKSAGIDTPYALFVPLASYDSKPYFNTFRKNYKSKHNCRCEVAIIARGDMSREYIKDKINKSDIIYFGAGNTRYLIEQLKKYDLVNSFIDAYNRGVIIAGLSAGGAFLYEYIFSDYLIMEGSSTNYSLIDGIGLLKGMICPHYDDNDRKTSFDAYVLNNYKAGCEYYGVENLSALCYNDDNLYSIGSGNSYKLYVQDNKLIHQPIIKQSMDND